MGAVKELAPCPFCGRPAKVNAWWSEREECGIAHVHCTKSTYFNGPECAQIYVYRNDPKTAEKDAIEIWNRRVER